MMAFSQAEQAFMWRYQAIGFTHRIATEAGPRVVCGMRYHAGPDRVEFNVTIIGQAIARFIHQRRPEPAFPQGTASTVGAVDGADRIPVQISYHHRHALRVPWCKEKMYMIGHQYIGMEFAIVLATGCSQQIQIESIVIL